MDAASDPLINEVVVMSSAQIGKTEFLLNIVGYYIHQDPSPIMLLQPTLDMAEAFSKDRLSPMIRDTPALTGKIADPRARDSGNTMLHKKFPGGQITMAGANSPASLASRPIRVVMCDEVDRYPMSAGTEGDPVSLARKRTNTFWNRKIILVSTPTIADVSRIEYAYNRSDMREFFVPCPHCGYMHTLKWKNVVFEEGKADEATMKCPECDGKITDQHKPSMLSRGVWLAQGETKSIAGFHINELYSPWRKFGDVASDFVASKNEPEKLKTWVNTSLGEVWREQGEQADPSALISRREDYDEIPKCLFRTAGVDVQKDRLECTVVDWHAGEEAYTMDHIIVPGDTAQPAVWLSLDEELQHWAPNFAAIDSGYNTSMVYAYVEKRRWACAVKGRPGVGIPLVEDEKTRRQRLRRQRKKGITVHMVGDNQAKSLIYSRLKITKPGYGYIHFPNDPAFDDEYFEQLTAERLVTKTVRGRPTAEWLQTRPRNETLDCFKYALAALRLSGADLVAISASRKKEAPKKEPEKLNKPPQFFPKNQTIGW